MSDRPDLDEAIDILQNGGFNITGGKYAPQTNSIRDILLTYGGYCSQQVEASDDDPQFFVAVTAINAYILGEVMAIIGEDFEFERPKDDYLPNFYIHAKAKNELRQVLRNKANKKWGK